MALLQNTSLDGCDFAMAAKALCQLGEKAATEEVITAVLAFLQNTSLDVYSRARVADTLGELSKLKLEKISQTLLLPQDFAFLILIAYLTKTFSLQIQENISSKQFFLQAYLGKRQFISNTFESSKAEELLKLARKVIKKFQENRTMPNDIQ